MAGKEATGGVLVWTTMGADADAEALAERLVAERLAACVAVHAPMVSVYRWKDGLERDRERQLVIKTTAARVPALIVRLRELHPYEVPEILVTPVVDGSPEYLAWLRASVDESA